MVFTTHLFLFYYLSIFLIIYYLFPFRSRTALIALAQLSVLRLGESALAGADVLELGGRLPLRPGASETVEAAVGRRPAAAACPRARRGAADADGRAGRLDRFEPGPSGVLQVHRIRGRELERAVAIVRSGRGLVPALEIALPVGISFYTFKSMSYAIDVYRGDARPMVNFIDFCCFEAFFPDLVAGPIVRYGAIEQQMRQRSHTAESSRAAWCSSRSEWPRRY